MNRAGKKAAFGQQLRTGGTMDCAIDTPATEE
jgi:hypothetical protein